MRHRNLRATESVEPAAELRAMLGHYIVISRLDTLTDLSPTEAFTDNFQHVDAINRAVDTMNPGDPGDVHRVADQLSGHLARLQEADLARTRTRQPRHFASS